MYGGHPNQIGIAANTNLTHSNIEILNFLNGNCNVTDIYEVILTK